MTPEAIDALRRALPDALRPSDPYPTWPDEVAHIPEGDNLWDEVEEDLFPADDPDDPDPLTDTPDSELPSDAVIEDAGSIEDRLAPDGDSPVSDVSRNRPSDTALTPNLKGDSGLPLHPPARHVSRSAPPAARPSKEDAYPSGNRAPAEGGGHRLGPGGGGLPPRLPRRALDHGRDAGPRCRAADGQCRGDAAAARPRAAGGAARGVRARARRWRGAAPLRHRAGGRDRAGSRPPAARPSRSGNTSHAGRAARPARARRRRGRS